MREIIEQYAASEYAAGDYEAVVTALNTPSIPVKRSGVDGRPAGFATLATMASDLGIEATVVFQQVIVGAADAMEASGEPEQIGQARLIRAFLMRFETTQEGLDFNHDDLRDMIAGIFVGAGVDPTPYLELGRKLETPAAYFGRTIDLQAVTEHAEQEARDAELELITNRCNAAIQAAETAASEKKTPDEMRAAAEAAF